VGPDASTRPSDASIVAGPLWCAPITTGLAAVWIPNGCDIETLHVSNVALSPSSRHLIRSPDGAFSFGVVESTFLQDGLPCRVTSRTEGGSHTEARSIRLAHWGVAGARQVIAFVIQNILPERPADHTVLDRYLSLLSAWRLPASPVAALGSWSLVRLPPEQDLGADRFRCYLWSGQKLHQHDVDGLRTVDGTILVLPEGRCERGFAAIGDDLVELAVSGEPATQAQTASFLRGLSRPSACRLWDVLSDRATAGDKPIEPFATAGLMPVSIPLAEPGAALRIEECVLLEDRLVVRLELSGSFDLDDPQLAAFGGGGPPRPSVITDRFSVEAETGSGAPTRRIVLVGTLGSDHAPLGCRIGATVGGLPIATWMRVLDGASHAGTEAIRRFWPEAGFDEGFIDRVASPMAEAWTRGAAPAPRASRRVGSSPEESGVRVEILCEDSLDGLHSTLVGMRASLPPDHRLRLLLRTHEGQRDVATAAAWLEAYGLDGTVDPVPLTVPASLQAFAADTGTHGPAIVTRAGFIPPRAGWIEAVLESLEREPDTVLVGVPGGGRPTDVRGSEDPAILRPMPIRPETLIGWLGASQLAAIAVPRTRTRPSEPCRCHTAWGAWAEQLCRMHDRGTRIVAHPALAFWNTNGPSSCGPVPHRIDAASLDRDRRRQAAGPGSTALGSPLAVLPTGQAERDSGGRIVRRRTG
jgi:hypothetical protein